MKNVFALFGLIGACLCGFDAGAVGVSYGTNAGTRSNTSGTSGTTSAAAATINSATTKRGYQNTASIYANNQRNTYYLTTQPDVDTACRERIFNCLTEYCGDTTVLTLPNSKSRCQYASESELYNYALLCLQKDTTVLLPQYNTTTAYRATGVNTAARLCPSYVQQELMSFLAMSNMATQLSKSHSDTCLLRRKELEAAFACYAAAMAYGNETNSMLQKQLTEACGAGVDGGSPEMVMRFANAGNLGADIWGWAEKVVSLNVNNKKSADWKNDVEAVLATYTNRMNLACGENMQLNTTAHTTSGNQTPALQAVAAIAIGAAFPDANVTITNTNNPYANQSIYMDVSSMSELYDYKTAYQVVQAGLSNSALTQNAFLTSAQMDSMQTAYKRGTKVFIIRDSVRCFIVPVDELSPTETSFMAQTFSTCIYQ